MKEKSKEAGRHVQAVLNALSILDCLQDTAALPLREVSAQTRLNKSRVMRLCGTLAAKGYLVHDLEANLYRIGPRLLSLGKAYERSHSLISLARPILREMVRRTGESATLYVVEGLERLVLAREEGSHTLRYSISEGQRLPLYTGASGKVLLAYGPESLRRMILKKSILRPLTNNTIVDPESLRRELETIRKQGYGVSAGERSLDGGALAAPVFDHEPKICAAIGIAGPIQRVREHHEEYVQALMPAAHQLSAALGYKDEA
jgi:DNA-binding IclR family transcriptional regulator